MLYGEGRYEDLEKFSIIGGQKLNGEVSVSGAKNAAVAIIPAAIMAMNGVCKIENVPKICDVEIVLKILNEMNIKTSYNKDVLLIDSTEAKYYIGSYELFSKMRASYYLLGALLARFGRAEVPIPGGCPLGPRPIDQHMKGIEALGAKVIVEHGIMKVQAEKLIGNTIYLDVISVGATINTMLAAVGAEGITVIENAAKEPHVVDTAIFLNSMGANIKGAGTDTIKIIGKKNLVGSAHSVIPDQIEAGTFMIIAAATNGNILIKNVIPKHLEAVTAKLEEVGARIQILEDSIRVNGTGQLNKVNVKTLPYPGFPTDLQPIMATMLSIAEGSSLVTEGIWDSRYKYVGELRRLGADINVDGKLAIINGSSRLTGAPVHSTDLRAGAALVLAGLIADGVTEVIDLSHIDRG